MEILFRTLCPRQTFCILSAAAAAFCMTKKRVGSLGERIQNPLNLRKDAFALFGLLRAVTLQEEVVDFIGDFQKLPSVCHFLDGREADDPHGISLSVADADI